jgi:predicted PurR-regulated permease PerM
MSTTKLEKESLEAHVDLCAERYEHLKQELKTLQDTQDSTNRRLDKLDLMMEKIADKLTEKENSALKSILGVAGTLILTLLGTLGGVLWFMLTTTP